MRWRRGATGLLAVGALLRALLLYFPRSGDDDTEVYAELGRNLLHHGTYGMFADGVLSPSLFRLPGYPLFFALLGGKVWLVLLVQCAVDLLGCPAACAVCAAIRLFARGPLDAGALGDLLVHGRVRRKRAH